MVARKPIIAIDGPAGAGKSSTARRVAAGLGFPYIDTGAMYRAVAWQSLEAGVDLADVRGLERLAEAITIRFEPALDGSQRVFVGGIDVTEAIRTSSVTQLSSPVSAIPGVRKVLVALQQNMGAYGGVVMEGRDIGTIVFPQAEIKIFLTASDEERARRRYRELLDRGVQVELHDILAQQRERDARDSGREAAPLKPAPDSIILNSDHLSLDQVVAQILELAQGLTTPE